MVIILLASLVPVTCVLETPIADDVCSMVPCAYFRASERSTGGFSGALAGCRLFMYCVQARASDKVFRPNACAIGNTLDG